MKYSEWMLCVCLFFSLSTAIVQEAQCAIWGSTIRSETSVATRRSPFWLLPTGGSQVGLSWPDATLVIGTVGCGDTTIQVGECPSAALLPADGLESLAIVADVLVWKVTNAANLNESELDAIWRGARRRASAEGLGKVRLLVVVVDHQHMRPETSPQALSWEETRDRVIHRVGIDLPSALDSFDVVPSSQKDKVLREISGDVKGSTRGGDESMLLLSRVYKALTSKELVELDVVDGAFADEKDDLLDDATGLTPQEDFERDVNGGELPLGEEAMTSDITESQTTPPATEDDVSGDATLRDDPTESTPQDGYEIRSVEDGEIPPRKEAIASDITESKTAAPEIEAEQVLVEAQAELEQLQTQQLEEWLEDHASDSLREAAVVKFGKAADAIFDRVECRIRDRAKSAEVLKRLMPQMQGLFQNQLDSLRDHYGRAYERLLEIATNEEEKSEAARSTTSKFRSAATAAIPKLCQEGGMFRDAADFSYIQSLQGLLSDMMSATEASNDDGLQDVGTTDNNVDDDTTHKRKGPAKWYQRLAARAVMLGVNYLQGWLAWQGIRRAAADRDRDMPKFPLF